MIGYELEGIQKKDNARDVAGDYQPMMGGMGMGQDPEKIDFTSDVTLVDVVREIDWGSRLRPDTSYQMLYYDAEKKMQQAAVGKSNWRADIRSVYDDIQESIARGVERRNPGMMQGEMMPDEMMMMEEMMMMMPQ